jgi:hypothetical protein
LRCECWMSSFSEASSRPSDRARRSSTDTTGPTRRASSCLSVAKPVPYEPQDFDILSHLLPVFLIRLSTKN